MPHSTASSSKTDAGKKYNGQFECLFDVAESKANADEGAEVGDLIKKLSVKNITFKEAQNIVNSITLILLKKYFDNVDSRNIILMPVLRSGLAMWSAANVFFNFPESSFPVCHKDKGTSNVFVLWPALPNLKDKEIIILDTVIATGDTINALCSHIQKLYPGCNLHINILSCYASPQAIHTVLNKSNVKRLIIGGISKTVNEHGYLIPLTNGDIGDKLFGNKNVDFMHDLRVGNTQKSFFQNTGIQYGKERFFKENTVIVQKEELDVDKSMILRSKL